MKLASACPWIAVSVCFFGGIRCDDADGYTPPKPLTEAVTLDAPAADINDDNATFSTGKKDNLNGDNVLSAIPDANSVDHMEGEVMSTSTEKQNLMSVAENSASSSALEQEANSSLGDLNNFATKSSEVAPKNQNEASTFRNMKRKVYHSAAAEIMGGDFNTEENQRMVESFLSMRQPMLRALVNRDL